MRGARGGLLAAMLVAGALGTGGSMIRAEETNRLEQLDQKVRILERKMEIADEAAAAKAKEAPVLTAGKDGFALSSPDKTFQLKLRGYAQADSRFFLDDSDDMAVDTFAVRRARVIMEGILARQFEFRVAPDFGGGKAELQDGYVDYKPSEFLSVRFGRTKVPFGMERLQSSADTLFNEAGMSTALTPNYDEGVMLYGSVGAGVLEYALGVFNGGPDGASVDADANDAKDWAARVVLTPFKKSGLAAVSGLSLGVAGTIGKQEGASTAPGLPSIRSSGQQTIFSYKTSSTPADVAFADGDRTRLAPQLYWVAGPFGLLGEYVVSGQEVANGSGSETIRNEAWQVAASWVLTGESPSLKGVKPFRPFNVPGGDWGAIEIAARVGGLATDDDAFADGYADRRKAVSSAANVGAGINWYLTRNMKFTVDWEQTTFKDGGTDGDRPDEQVVIARAQVAW